MDQGQQTAAKSLSVVLASDSPALPAATGGATSVKQSDGSQKTQVVDSGGTNLGTTANPVVTKTGGTATTDAGQTLTLNTTNAFTFAAAATSGRGNGGGIIVSAPLANTAPVYLARANTLTTATGIELLPGDSIPLPCDNANEWSARTGTATQVLQAVAF